MDSVAVKRALLRRHPESERAFTLLELMIVVAIIALLSLIAYPTYQESVARSRRSEAVNALLAAAQALERYYTINDRYTQSDGELPSVFSAEVPASGATFYRIKPLSPASAVSYALLAEGIGSMANDDCGDFSIDQTGTIAIHNLPAASAKTLADCWRH